MFNFRIGNLIMPDELGNDNILATKALEEHTVHGLVDNIDLKFDLGRHGAEDYRSGQ